MSSFLIWVPIPWWVFLLVPFDNMSVPIPWWVFLLVPFDDMIVSIPWWVFLLVPSSNGTSRLRPMDFIIIKGLDGSQASKHASNQASNFHFSSLCGWWISKRLWMVTNAKVSSWPLGINGWRKRWSVESTIPFSKWWVGKKLNGKEGAEGCFYRETKGSRGRVRNQWEKGPMMLWEGKGWGDPPPPSLDGPSGFAEIGVYKSSEAPGRHS